MMNSVIPFPPQTQADVSDEIETHDDGLGCARGLIHATPIALLLWGFILGALMWVL